MKNVDEIVISARLWNRLLHHLLDFSDEQLAFMFASSNSSNGVVKLVVHELLCADFADLDHQSGVAVSPSGEFVAKALTKCKREGWNLVEVHSHPFDSSQETSFSGIDWANDRVKMPQVSAMMHHPFVHATMVVGQNSLDAHYYDADAGSIHAMRGVNVVGGDVDELPVWSRVFATGYSSLESAPAYEPRLERQFALLGENASTSLSGAVIAVVGLGGLGSFVCQQLAYLGVGELILIDVDQVEITNLNRLIGAGPDDIGRSKVAVFEKILARTSPSVKVTAVHGSIFDGNVIDVAKRADLLVGCVDNHGARLVLNQLAMRFLIPLLDAGTGTRMGSGKVGQAGGQVQMVVPGVGCLECRGFIDPQRAAFDLAPHDIQEYERSHGYGTDEAAPSVIFLNGLVASVQVSEIARLFSAIPAADAHRIVVYDAKTQRTYVASSDGDAECATCGIDGVVGLGDLAPLGARHPDGKLTDFTGGPGVSRGGSDTEE